MSSVPLISVDSLIKEKGNLKPAGEPIQLNFKPGKFFF
jgi:hypothetical protein